MTFEPYLIRYSKVIIHCWSKSIGQFINLLKIGTSMWVIMSFQKWAFNSKVDMIKLPIKQLICPTPSKVKQFPGPHVFLDSTYPCIMLMNLITNNWRWANRSLTGYYTLIIAMLYILTHISGRNENVKPNN